MHGLIAQPVLLVSLLKEQQCNLGFNPVDTNPVVTNPVDTNPVDINVCGDGYSTNIGPGTVIFAAAPLVEELSSIHGSVTQVNNVLCFHLLCKV
jgi:hypothetical protein